MVVASVHDKVLFRGVSSAVGKNNTYMFSGGDVERIPVNTDHVDIRGRVEQRRVDEDLQLKWRDSAGPND